MTQPAIGMLWGDFPGERPPHKLGKHLRWGVVARNVSQALRLIGTVAPYHPPPADASPAEQRAALATFLRAVDVLWADFYPTTAPALHLRQQLNLPCRVVLFAGGTLPKGAEALLCWPPGSSRPPGGLVMYDMRSPHVRFDAAAHGQWPFRHLCPAVHEYPRCWILMR